MLCKKSGNRTTTVSGFFIYADNESKTILACGRTFQGISKSVFYCRYNACCCHSRCICHINYRHSANETGNQSCKKEGNKCMDLCFHYQDNHDNNTNCQSQHHSGGFTHLLYLSLCFMFISCSQPAHCLLIVLLYFILTIISIDQITNPPS